MSEILSQDVDSHCFEASHDSHPELSPPLCMVPQRHYSMVLHADWCRHHGPYMTPVVDCSLCGCYVAVIWLRIKGLHRQNHQLLDDPTWQLCDRHAHDKGFMPHCTGCSHPPETSTSEASPS